jgi:uncharacterized protein (DUF362 family)
LAACATIWVCVMSAVSFVRCQENTLGSIKRAILGSLELINYSFPEKVNSVVIKPNMCYYWDYSTGQTTDPRVVAALIDVVRERVSRKIKISVVESDASAMKCRYAFPLLGYEKLARDYKVNLVNLSEDDSEAVRVTVNGHDFELPVPLTIRDADLRINVPKIKYMEGVRVSCAMKNIFGCNPIPLKYKFHPALDETIVALNKLMKFQLHILDGMVLTGVFPRRFNLVAASEDPVALDAVAFRITGENPHKARSITLAQKEGLGSMHYDARGIDPKELARRFPKRTFTSKLIASAYNMAVRMGVVQG